MTEKPFKQRSNGYAWNSGLAKAHVLNTEWHNWLVDQTGFHKSSESVEKIWITMAESRHEEQPSFC